MYTFVHDGNDWILFGNTVDPKQLASIEDSLSDQDLHCFQLQLILKTHAYNYSAAG